MTAVAAVIVALLVAGSPVAPSVCEFKLSSGRWQGSCGEVFGQVPSFTMTEVAGVATGTWRQGAQPRIVWAGSMTDAGHADARVELEVYENGDGVFRSEYGWFHISGFSVADHSAEFRLDVGQEVRASDFDREIVRRAAAILSSVSRWNRADSRTCRVAATVWSMYCALERATVEVSGGFHHRRPALEVVRQIVGERAVGRGYHHRLMDYNNDPSTRLEDVQSVLAEALVRMGP